MTVKIRTSIEISAGIDEVWAAVSDMNTWGDWSKWTKFSFDKVEAGM